MSETNTELWRHPEPQKSQLYEFQQHVRQKHNIQGNSYNDLYEWSVASPADFWEEVWHYTGIKASKPYDQVITSAVDSGCYLMIYRYSVRMHLCFPNLPSSPDVP